MIPKPRGWIAGTTISGDSFPSLLMAGLDMNVLVSRVYTAVEQTLTENK